jgi:MoxR-like ATPase
MEQTYFAISVADPTRPTNRKLQFFRGQKDIFVNEIDINKTVSDKSPKNIEFRNARPIGTIFILKGSITFVLKHYQFEGTIEVCGTCSFDLTRTNLLNGEEIPPFEWESYTYSSDDTPNMMEFMKFLENHLTVFGESEYKKGDLELPKTLLSKDLNKHPCPTIEDDGFYVDKELWSTLVYAYKNKQNLMLTGPTGVGKTEVLQMLTSKMGRKPTIIDMGTMQDPLSGLIGVHRLEIDEEGKQVSNFDLADLPIKIAQRNSVIVFDEISRAPAMANNILFPLLDARGELHLNLASSKMERVVKKDPSVRFFATANLGNEYTGASQLDRALIDRFMLAEVSYIPAGIEAKLLTKVSGISLTEAEAVTKVAETIRLLAVKGELSTGVSTRLTKLAANMLKYGMSLSQALKAAFLPYYEGSEFEGERSQIYAIIKSR